MTGIDRRMFITGAAVTGALAAVPTVLLPAASTDAVSDRIAVFVGLAPGDGTELKRIDGPVVEWIDVTTTAAAAVFYDEQRRYVAAVDFGHVMQTENGTFTVDMSNVLNDDGTVRYQETHR